MVITACYEGTDPHPSLHDAPDISGGENMDGALSHALLMEIPYLKIINPKTHYECMYECICVVCIHFMAVYKKYFFAKPVK